MKLPREWDEDYILSLPIGEFNWLEAKGRKALDLTLPTVRESDVLDTLAKAVSAFANSGGGQLVFGLSNPSSPVGKWLIDDGGIAVTIKGRIDTREWLEEVIPNLVEFPLTDFNVYAILPVTSHSQISPDRAVYVVDIADSLQAPHQSRIDNKYYARIAGKSRPIGHRMIADIMGRRQHPKIELEFSVESKFIKGKPTQPGFDITSIVTTTGVPVRPPKEDTFTYKLTATARNNGRVYAQYVNCFILIPIEVLPQKEIEFWKASALEDRGGQKYCSYYKENSIRDFMGLQGMRESYGPSRFDPILPRLSHSWEIKLRNNIQQLKTDNLKILWTTYADNSTPESGEINLKDIRIIDAKEPDFDDYTEDDD